MSLLTKVRFWARHNSVRLAAVAGPVAGWAVEHRAELGPVLDHLPSPLPGLITFAICTVLPIWARTASQGGLSKPNGQ